MAARENGWRRRFLAFRHDSFSVEVEHGTAELVAVSARLGEAYSDGDVGGGHGGVSAAGRTEKRARGRRARV